MLADVSRSVDCGHAAGRADFRSSTFVMVFLALLVVWDWPEGGRIESTWGTDAVPVSFPSKQAGLKPRGFLLGQENSFRYLLPSLMPTVCLRLTSAGKKKPRGTAADMLKRWMPKLRAARRIVRCN